MINTLYIGDNIIALKNLQETHLGMIKMIYIDPPYNTMSKKTYNDNMTHKQWVYFMLPRLVLARDLLRDDGVIFISIDDNEQARLKLLCDEIFGEENFVANFVWERAYSPKNNAKTVSCNHDFIFCYARNKGALPKMLLPRTEEANARYKNPDSDFRGRWLGGDLTVPASGSDKMCYLIITPAGNEIYPPSGNSWRFTKEKYHELVKDNRIHFPNDGKGVPCFKRFLSDVQDGMTPKTLWKHTEVGHTQEGAKETKKLFDDKAYFDYPKPIRLMKRILHLGTQIKDENGKTTQDKDCIILDFFAGSGTTGQAVMELNAEDGGNRKFILVQIAEPCDEKSEAYKAGYKTIADICKERLNRVHLEEFKTVYL